MSLHDMGDYAPARNLPVREGLSLSRKLLLWVLLPQVVLWLAGGVATYHLAAGYVNQAIDNGLLQSSRSLARQLKPIGNGLFIDFPRAAQDVLEADPEDRQYYMVSSPPGEFVLGNRMLPPPPIEAQVGPLLNQPYFYDGDMLTGTNSQVQRVRVVALYLSLEGEPNAPPQTMLVQIARSNNTREHLARRILVDMLLPMSTLVLLMTVIVWVGIRAGLAPLTRLRQQVEGRAPSDLAPLRLDVAPIEIRALVRALNTLLTEAREHVETQKRFIGDAAHQLRTPLAGLKSQTELALQQASDPELRQRLQRVHESATRSAHLVSQLLALARTTPEAVEAMYAAPFDLRATLQELVAESVPRALKAHVDLGWDDGVAQPVWVRGQPTLMREAVFNLIDNALRYAGADSEVTVGLTTQDGQARIRVADDGPGIAEDVRDRVFERFFRATDQGSGCGLGLAIVRNIVERHDGHVELNHPQPHGLEVTIVLPLASAPAAASSASG
jgi:two-component system sensor histidine kinase TctE